MSTSPHTDSTTSSDLLSTPSQAEPALVLPTAIRGIVAPPRPYIIVRLTGLASPSLRLLPPTLTFT